MKITFIVGSLSGGGAERVVAELASQMSMHGETVRIILASNNIVTYEIPKSVEIVDCSYVEKSIRGISFLKRIKRIRTVLIDTQTDVCISFTVGVNIYALLSCLFLRCKLIISERNDPRFDPANKLVRLLRSFLYPLADRIVFQTEGEKEYFSSNIQRKSVVIPNPVNPNLPDCHTEKRRKVFVTVARLYPQKNLYMAIDAFSIINKSFPEYSFEIFGEGILRLELQNYIDKLGLKDKVLLMGASKHIYEDIKDAFAFVLSSNYEGISNSMLEAMALGIPTISTDYPSGGAREIIADGYNGYLVPLKDPLSLANKMIHLIKNESTYKMISENCRYIRTKYNLKDITNQWMDVILHEHLNLNKED